MKIIKAVKTSSRKNNPIVSAPAEKKSFSQPILESQPVKTNGAPETLKETPTPVAESKPAKKTNRSATIEVKMDVGFGNTLYLRGEGKGLTWNQGIPLRCVDGSTWQWSGEADEKLKFKVLLNDAVWAKGDDLVIAPGEKLQISPTF